MDGIFGRKSKNKAYQASSLRKLMEIVRTDIKVSVSCKFLLSSLNIKKYMCIKTRMAVRALDLAAFDCVLGVPTVSRLLFSTHNTRYRCVHMVIVERLVGAGIITHCENSPKYNWYCNINMLIMQ